MLILRFIRNCGVLLCLMTNLALASDNKPQCPNVKLLQKATPEEISLSMVKPNDSAFFTDQYCLALFGPTLHDLLPTFSAFYKGEQSGVVFRNYLQTFDRLHSLDQRFMFVHFFLQQLSQKMTVVGRNGEDNEFHILIRIYLEGKDHPYWYRMNLTGDIPYQDFMHALSKVQQGNPQPEDYPAVMMLVEKVMDGNHYLTNNELNTLIQNL